MHPIMFTIPLPFIGDVYLHSYGVTLAIGFMVGISIAVKEAKRVNVDPEKILNMTFFILIAAIIGSRLFHCIVYWEQYIKDPIRILKLWEGGLVFYGGFILAFTAGTIYVLTHKMDFWKCADISSLSVAIGLMFGRIGCTLAGCCYGKPCDPDFPFGIVFSNPLGLGQKDVPLYPTQPFSAICALALFILLWSIRKRARYSGWLTGVFLFIYSIVRSTIELYRNDPRGFLNVGGFELSESQVVSVFMFLFAIYIFTFRRRSALKDAHA